MRGPYDRLAGRFILINKINDHEMIIGCVGSLTAKSLSSDEMNYIASFYSVGFPTEVHVTEHKIIGEYDGKHTCPSGLLKNCNSFIYLKCPFTSGIHYDRKLKRNRCFNGVEV